jgi:ABC-type bacteriocin/lantibiotic exporter with double-glycine peptidase domain
VSNYYDAIIPQTDTATKYFFISIPIMIIALIIMLISEWKTKLRWVPLAWIPGLFVPVITQQKFIEDINDQFKAGITDQAVLQDLLKDWMFYNDIRFYILTVMWCITMYFFIAKAQKP